ncbi:type II toxin-antitoxin system HigB family toxin [Chitinophaga sp. 22620]|uniref:type II toxin-antitoxin system HigB family toxin n=1 Tax=Chitinophaga sp. 22620 TaxID=3453952 RepID=UPI003F845F33
MRVISRPVIISFGLKHPGAVIPLNDWYKKITQAQFNNFNELKHVFRSCDYIGDFRYVFNVGGNNYRLVGMINFKTQVIYIRGILIHREYDEDNKRGALIRL